MSGGRATRRCFYAALVALLTVGCAYHSPDAPSAVTPISAAVPFSLTLGATAGTGADAGRATITAKVQNVNGAPLGGVPVQFATDAGTLSATTVATAENGLATTTITAPDTAAITATAGTLTTHLLVANQPVVAVPTPTPAPTPAPQPTPAPPLGPLSMTISATSATVGTATIFSADVRNVSGAFSVAWNFGDGATGTSISSTTAHTYAAAGAYRASAVLRDDAGRSASATVDVSVAAVPGTTPPPTRSPAISASLSCTEGTASTPVNTNLTLCNVTVTDEDGAVITGQIASDGVAWDWGDGPGGIGSVGVVSHHKYAQPGDYTVSATVTFGSLRTTVTKVLTIPA